MKSSSIVTLGFVSLVALSSTVACGSAPDGGEPVAQSVNQGLVASVPAGAHSRASGVARWTVGHATGKVTIHALDANEQSVHLLHVRSTVDAESGLRQFHVESADGELRIDEKGRVMVNTMSPRGHLALQYLTEDVNRFRAENPVAYSCTSDVLLFVGALGVCAAACLIPEPAEPVACVATFVALMGAWSAVIDSCGL